MNKICLYEIFCFVIFFQFLFQFFFGLDCIFMINNFNTHVLEYVHKIFYFIRREIRKVMHH